MAIVEFIFDIKDPSWLTGNTNVPKNGEPVFLNDGRFCFGDGITQVQNLVFFGSGGIYLGQSPTTVTVGGLPSGSAIYGLPVTTILQMILCPYQSPAITSLTSPIFAVYEVGESVNSGLNTINYTVSHPTNIKTPQPPNVGVQTTNIIGATFPLNPSVLTGSGSFQINIPANTKLNVQGSMNVGLSGTNSNDLPIPTVTNTLNWRQRVFHGQDSNTSLTAPQILALQNSQLKTGFAGTYSFSTGGYKYFCYPSSMGLATTFTDTSNGFPVAMFGTIGVVSVTNAYSVTENYNVHRTLNILGGSINIAIS
jgi:hypothetical protein